MAVLNTPFCLLHSRKAALPAVKDWFASPSVAAAHFNPYQQLTGGPFRPLNVVVLIVESLSAEYVGALNTDVPDCPSYTPYLDARLLQAGWYTKGYTNGRTSVEALPAILASLPSWMPEPFIRSGFNQRPVCSLAHYLRPHGYTSAFYHGGQNGTMGFDVFCKASGIDHYIGLNEYPNAAQDHDGCWGIYDEPFLQFVVQHLSQLPSPFFGTVFTLSSHHPYRVPQSMDNLSQPLTTGPLPLHRSIAYADYALEQFFRSAAQQAWFPHTLFVLVADHPSLVQHPAYHDTACPHHRIPIIFYHPGNPQLKGRWDGIAQQTDILPSILHYLGYSGPITAFGSSIWQSTCQNSCQEEPQQRFALIHDGGHYCLRRPHALLVATPQQVLHHGPRLPGTAAEPLAQAHLQLRALLYLYSQWLRQDLPESATGRQAVGPCSVPGGPDAAPKQQ
jgi:phosphoglycerol transferase MdoB-like AlkP superfamily enzyme